MDRTHSSSSQDALVTSHEAFALLLFASSHEPFLIRKESVTIGRSKQADLYLGDCPNLYVVLVSLLWLLFCLRLFSSASVLTLPQRCEVLLHQVGPSLSSLRGRDQRPSRAANQFVLLPG